MGIIHGAHFVRDPTVTGTSDGSKISMGFSVPLVSKAASLALVSGQILVVEDNAEVGEFSSQLLRDLGYQTVLASNGKKHCNWSTRNRRAPMLYSATWSCPVSTA
jgi:hypothetical protein